MQDVKGTRHENNLCVDKTCADKWPSPNMQTCVNSLL